MRPTRGGGLEANVIRILSEENARLRALLEPIVDPGANWQLTDYPQLYLPKSEKRILRVLHIHMGGVVRASALWDMLYAARPDSDQPSTPHIVSVHIAKLRGRLRVTPYRIATHHGIGWSLHKD